MVENAGKSLKPSQHMKKLSNTRPCNNTPNWCCDKNEPTKDDFQEDFFVEFLMLFRNMTGL